VLRGSGQVPSGGVGVWGAQTRSVCRQDAGSLDYSCRVFRREVTKVVNLANEGDARRPSSAPTRSEAAHQCAQPRRQRTTSHRSILRPHPVDSRSTPRQLAVAVPTDSDSGPTRQDEVQSHAFVCGLQEGFSQREEGSDKYAVLHVFPRRERPATDSFGRGSSGCRIASSQGTDHAGRGGSDGDEETEATSNSNRNRRDHEAQAEEDLAREIAPRPACARPAGLSARRRRLHARSLAAYLTLFRVLARKRQRPWSGDRKRFRRRSG
jgi:hypothetical protein